MIGVFHPSNKPLLQVSNLDQNGTWILCAVKMISAITTSFPGPFPWQGKGPGRLLSIMATSTATATPLQTLPLYYGQPSDTATFQP